jgi:hypothetical protein
MNNQALNACQETDHNKGNRNRMMKFNPSIGQKTKSLVRASLLIGTLAALLSFTAKAKRPSGCS